MNPARRVSRFLLVGVFNTALDFSILNALVFAFGIAKLPANIVSAAIAMIASYILNHRFVFRESEEKNARQFVLFIAITATGLFVLQNIIIYLFTHQLRSIADAVFTVLDWLSSGVFSKEFVELNIGKAVATVATMIWNYKLYQRFVFMQKRGSEHSERSFNTINDVSNNNL